MTTVAEVRLWGTRVGAVALQDGERVASFQYAPDFVGSGIELSPIVMPLRSAAYQFPVLSRETFVGLPGMLADCLPDRYGNALIDAWLATQGRAPGSLNPVERLCYSGKRAMGALEFEPALGPNSDPGAAIEVGELVKLASSILSSRRQLNVSFAHEATADALAAILRVGTSAGGARAKAVIAYNPQTGEVRSGQLDVPAGFQHWLLKFDGVTSNGDKELADASGYGAIEYAYHRMARDAGLQMSDCQLLEEGGRRHFMTRRFDRTAEGDKLHMQSLGALAHLDFNMAGASSYEQAFLVMRQLGLAAAQRQQLFRRVLFNVVARNQDDHVKNISFLMDRSGTWSLAPAYDVMFSYQPQGQWTARHQMSLNGKRDDFTPEDIDALGEVALLPRGKGKAMLEEITDVVSRWDSYARDADVDAPQRNAIADAHRLSLLPRARAKPGPRVERTSRKARRDKSRGR